MFHTISQTPLIPNCSSKIQQLILRLKNFLHKLFHRKIYSFRKLCFIMEFQHFLMQKINRTRINFYQLSFLEQFIQILAYQRSADIFLLTNRVSRKPLHSGCVKSLRFISQIFQQFPFCLYAHGSLLSPLLYHFCARKTILSSGRIFYN